MNREREENVLGSQKSGTQEGPEVAEAEEETVEGLKAKLAEEKERAEQYLAQWQRAQADYINLRRRTEQERSESARFSNAMLIINLLPILDDLERALDSVSVNLAGLTWVEGIRLIHQNLRATLEAEGLIEIPAEGQDFDPNLHEAVMQVAGEEGKVISVLQKGYRLYDRVLRPAMVAVGHGGEQPLEPGQKPSK